MRVSGPSRTRSRTALALGLSALAHFLFVVWLLRQPPTMLPSPELDRAAVLDVEIRSAPAAREPTTAPPVEDRVVPVHRGAAKQGATAKQATARGPEIGASATTQRVAEDVPRRLDLSVPAPYLPHLPGERDDLEGGRTFRADPRAKGRPPGELAAEAQARIDGWFEDDAAERRVQDGLVDPWFAKLKKRFEHDASQPRVVPEHVLARVGPALVDSYFEEMRRYGATGSPRAAPAGRGSSLPAFGGTGVNDQLGMTLDPGSAPVNALGPIGEKLSLVAVVDLRQEADGSLLSAEIVVRSGDADFDRYVLDVIPKSLALVSPPPDAGLGMHEKGSHTVWEFAGRLAFARDLREVNLARDGWYFVPAAILGGLKFDEVSGYVAAADLLHPYYKCAVRLLRVY
jgi:hypothetical protein